MSISPEAYFSTSSRGSRATNAVPAKPVVSDIASATSAAASRELRLIRPGTSPMRATHECWHRVIPRGKPSRQRSTGTGVTSPPAGAGMVSGSKRSTRHCPSSSMTGIVVWAPFGPNAVTTSPSAWRLRTVQRMRKVPWANISQGSIPPRPSDSTRRARPRSSSWLARSMSSNASWRACASQALRSMASRKPRTALSGESPGVCGAQPATFPARAKNTTKTLFTSETYHRFRRSSHAR